jgi:hypothetical protein
MAYAVGVDVGGARGRFGIPEERKRVSVKSWKPLPSNGSKDVTVDTVDSVFVCVCESDFKA